MVPEMLLNSAKSDSSVSRKGKRQIDRQANSIPNLFESVNRVACTGVAFFPVVMDTYPLKTQMPADCPSLHIAW